MTLKQQVSADFDAWWTDSRKLEFRPLTEKQAYAIFTSGWLDGVTHIQDQWQAALEKKGFTF